MLHNISKFQLEEHEKKKHGGVFCNCLSSTKKHLIFHIPSGTSLNKKDSYSPALLPE